MPLHIPSPRSKKHARIEIIPLIDIVFFLLATFVMVSMSMIKNKGISVQLPVASSGTPQERKEFSTITITAGGEVYFDKQPIAMEALDGALKGLLAANPEPRVFINGDAKAEFGKAIEVLDRVRKQGITKIAIETKPPPTGGAPTGATAPTPGTAPAAAPAPGAALTPAASPAAVDVAPPMEPPSPAAPRPAATPATPAPAPTTPEAQ